MNLPAAPWQLFGRRSSLFTRVVRVFAFELELPLELVRVDDMTALDPMAYGGHPALKFPTLRRGTECLIGTESICRQLARETRRTLQIAWPEDLHGSLCSNAQELVWHAMASQVQWIMSVQIGRLPADNVALAKTRAGFDGALRWLDTHIDSIQAHLPQDRNLSLLEVTLHCLNEHLPFRHTMTLEAYPHLQRFSRQWSERPSSQATRYRFDPQPVTE